MKINNFDLLCKNEGHEIAILMMHGYGANKEDLAPLADVFKEFPITWYFPDAPEIVFQTLFGAGRAWFPIDMAKLERAYSAHDHDLFYESMPENFDEVANNINEVLLELQKKHQNVIVGGFSQGSMMSVELSLRNDNANDLLLLSSAMIKKSQWQDKISKKNFGNVFQSHGREDNVLPFELGQTLSDQLKDHCANYTFETFTGGHEIPNKVLQKVAEYFSLFT